MRDLSYKTCNWCTNTNTSPNTNTRKHQYEHRHQHKRQHKELNLIKKRCRTCLQGLLYYAIKIAATWVACKKLHATIPRPFTLRIYHRTIFKELMILIDFEQLFGDCVPICDCVSKIWHCLSTKFKKKLSIIPN